MRARFLTAPTLSFLETISVPHNQWQPAVSNTMHCLRSEEHTSELQSRSDLVCRLLLEKKKNIKSIVFMSSPVSLLHAKPHLFVCASLADYSMGTPGLRGGANAYLQLHFENDAQPDAFT